MSAQQRGVGKDIFQCVLKSFVCTSISKRLLKSSYHLPSLQQCVKVPPSRTILGSSPLSFSNTSWLFLVLYSSITTFKSLYQDLWKTLLKLWLIWGKQILQYYKSLHWWIQYISICLFTYIFFSVLSKVKQFFFIKLLHIFLGFPRYCIVFLSSEKGMFLYIVFYWWLLAYFINFAKLALVLS